MWNDILLIEKIDMTQKVNILLYYLRMLPWIGKKIPEHLYANIKTKQVLAILAFLVTLLFNFALKAMYIGFLIVLPSVIMSGENGSSTFCMVFIFSIISGLAGPLLYDNLTQPAKKDYVMLQLMHMNSKRYVEANWMIFPLLQLVMMFLSILVLTFGNVPIWYVLALCLSAFFMRLFGNVYHLYFAQKKGAPFSAGYKVILCTFLYVLAYGGAFLLRASDFAWLIVLCFACVAGVCFLLSLHLKKKIQYDAVMRTLIAKNRNVIDGSFQKDIYTKDVEIREKDISKEELRNGKFQDKKGYAYLNALFFQRHKRLFYKPMRNRILLILAFFLMLDILLFFFSDMIEEVSPLGMLPPMVFVLYSISIGERVTRAMFYNCDVSLLRYGYYRQADAILTNFKIRLSKITLYNMILATLICIGFSSMTFFLTTPFLLKDLLLFAITVYSISFFFSVHHLCMYYLLQPYTGELEMKSPMFAAVGGIVYFISYMAMQIDGSFLFTIIVLIATLVYSIAALILVWKLAPKTFHIR